MAERRRDVSCLLQELRESCRRPLFVEINLFKEKSRRKIVAAPSKHRHANSEIDVASQSSSNRARSSAKRESNAEQEQQRRSWEELLRESAALLPCMTEQEHGQVLRLTSILLLGYLMPFSTGNEFFLLQNMPHTPKEAQDRQMAEYLVNMPLIDRLEKSVHRMTANDSPDMDCLTDMNVDVAFDSFLRNGIAPLLAGRPAHREEVDLLHLISMAIHPTVSIESVLVQTIRHLSDDSSNLADRPAWVKARQLEQAHAASLFQIHYGHRIQLVQMLVDHLVLPVVVADSIEPIADLLFGVLPHLRASLRSFAQATKSPRDAHLANVSFVKMAVQTANGGILHDDWDFLLERMVEDSADYGCTECHLRTDSTSITFPDVGAAHRATTFCRHSARGNLLAFFLISTCQSRELIRKEPEAASLLQRAASSLGDAIEWQLDSWTKVPEGEDAGIPIRHAPCLLASLMFASQALFFFMPASNEYDETRETLIESALQLMHHKHMGIARSSCQLLLHAFSIDSKSKTTCVAFAPALLQSATEFVKAKDAVRMHMLEPVIATAVDKSPRLGASFVKLLMKDLLNDDKDSVTREARFRWIASVASNCPSVVSCAKNELVEGLENEALPLVCRSQLAATILSNRLARFFNGDGQAAIEVVALPLDNWTRYKLACHALVTGNFHIASKLYQQLLSVSTLGEQFHVWLAVLQRCSAGEAALLNEGAMGIPSAEQHLRAAVSYIHFLPLLDQRSRGFQLRFLLLRLDFLDLLTVIRQLVREMRLTGAGPSKSTRSHQHLRNAIRSLVSISSRIEGLYRSSGMQFCYAQSGAAMRVFQELAVFMTTATRAVFSDVLVANTIQSSTAYFSSTSFRHPMAGLIRRLDVAVIQSMDGTVDPLIRAAAMLEVIDGVLMVPMPIPRDFFIHRSAVGAKLHLSVDPMQAAEADGTLSCIEVFPLMCFSFNASGTIEVGKASHPIRLAILWYRITYDGPLVEDENGADEANQDPNQDPSQGNPSADPTSEAIVKRLPNLVDQSPARARVNSTGQFFVAVECPPLLDEGFFTLEAKLGCQDALGNEWEIPVKQSHCRLSIKRHR